MRRVTRLTNAFSKKFENRVHTVALYTVFYNRTKVHKTPRVTPAMQAGLADHVWGMADVVALIEQAEMFSPGRSGRLRHHTNKCAEGRCRMPLGVFNELCQAVAVGSFVNVWSIAQTRPLRCGTESLPSRAL